MANGSEYKHFINGNWVAGESREMMDVINPANQEVVARVPKGTNGDVEMAVAAASKAFKSGVWSEKSPEERAQVLNRAAAMVAAEKEKLIYLESLTSGATLRMAGSVVNNASSILSINAATACALPKVEHATTLPVPMHSYWKREPVGVCAAITPWNCPLGTGMIKYAPALAMGNSVVAKPASLTPVTTLVLAKILYDAGVPAGVFNVVTGPGSTFGRALAEHPQIDKISFTGSTEVGSDLARSAAGGIKRITLELGGKSPLIILDDADMDTAAKMSVLAFCFHAGQICVSGTRVFVPRRLQEELASRMAAIVSKFVIGNQLDLATDMGPIISKSQLENIKRYVEIGKKEGAELVYGGNQLTDGELEKGFFINPAIFINCKNTMTQVREEIFGPVQCIIPYDDLDEAIEMANDSTFGLAGGVCGSNIARAAYVAAKIPTGTMFYNTWHSLRTDVPFGGYKQSGYGRENSYLSLQAYSELKSYYMNLAAGVDPFQMMGL